MPDKKEILLKIQDLRQQLYSLLAEKDNLQDDEIIKASKELDEYLAKYEGVIKKGL